MSQSEKNRVMVILSILERGRGRHYTEMLSEQGLEMHLISLGHGTAPSEMMDILGLGSNDKDVVISFAPEKSAAGLIARLTKNFENSTRYGGLMMLIRLSAISRLAAEIVTRPQADSSEKEEGQLMGSEGKFNLVLITVNQGYAEEVMRCAKKAGATGGTVIRGRMAGAEILRQLDDVDIQEEKEIIAILSPVSGSGAIMSAVNREFGLRTEAKGIVCALPVDKALKI